MLSEFENTVSNSLKGTFSTRKFSLHSLSIRLFRKHCKLTIFNFFNSIRRFFFAECRFAVNYAKYKELSKALSIRAFGVSASENAVFRMEKRRIRGKKTPFSPSKNAVFLFKNGVFSRKNGVFQMGVFGFV